jgi:disulfide bond formation protein DsbB
LELLIIPFVFALVALFLPQKAVRGYALIGALVSVVVGIIHAVGYTPSADFISLLPECSNRFFFNYGYDGIGLVIMIT